MTLFHEQYESAGALVLFRCSECGHTSMSLGSLHAHVEGHWSLLGMLTWHLTHLFEDEPAEKWMRHTEVLRVVDTEEIPLDDVEGL